MLILQTKTASHIYCTVQYHSLLSDAAIRRVCESPGKSSFGFAVGGLSSLIACSTVLPLRSLLATPDPGLSTLERLPRALPQNGMFVRCGGLPQRRRPPAAALNALPHSPSPPGLLQLLVGRTPSCCNGPGRCPSRRTRSGLRRGVRHCFRRRFRHCFQRR